MSLRGIADQVVVVLLRYELWNDCALAHELCHMTDKNPTKGVMVRWWLVIMPGW